MHAFNLVLGSVLAFPWAQDLVVSAQRVVTYFRASHQPMALLRAAAERFDIKSGLRSSNATRFTSKHECIKSVLANQAAFTLVLQNNRGVINNADVLAILDDTTFWADAAKLEKVLAPLSAVITVVQGNGTTLADVCRCWLYLVKDLGAVLDALPVDYQEHIIWAVSTRAKQQDDVLPRLALFLDPRFREAARATSDAAMTEFTEWLCEYAAAQGWAAPRITSVLGQLAQYGRGQPPFNLARASGTIFGTFSARGWWEVVGSNPAAADLAELATALFEVVPHAAAPERAFSTMGWYEGGKATRLAAGTNAQKTAIKMHYDTFKPKQDNKPAAATEVPDTVDLSGPAHIDAGALSDTAAAAAARAAAESQRSSNSSSGGGGGSGAGQQQQADAGEEAEEEATPEDVQAALAKQQEADRREREVLEVPEECRRDWRAAMKWATGAQQGADLLNPSYQEVPRGAQPREIGARQAGVDTAAILRQFRQQEQEAATAAAAAAAAAQQAVAAAAQQAGTAVDYVELLRQQAVLSALAQQGGAGHPQAGAAQQGGF